MRFARVATIDSGFYALQLPAIAERVYFYMSSKCARKWGVPVGDIVKDLHIAKEDVREALEMLIDRKMLKRWKLPRPKCTEYLITLSTEDGWGMGSKRSYSIGRKRSQSMVGKAPNNWEEKLPPLVTNDYGKSIPGDSILFEMFSRHFKTWRFNRKPIGAKFHFTRKMMVQAMECMRHLNTHLCTTKEFDEWLSDCGEYLSHPRDVLSHSKDLRALTPTRWLNDWPEQVRLAGIYHDEKREKITRFGNGQPE